MELPFHIKLPGLSPKRNKKTLQASTPNYLMWAFLIPFLGMLAIMIIARSEPFGDNYSMLFSDMYHQYYPFFYAFRKALRSGDSLLYSWNVGMGMDYLGLASYYLASPLNLLSVLVPDNLVLEYFSLLVPIKLGLASLFFAIFLKNLFSQYDLSISLFGALYGLCAWALGYQWNIMWLDTFALLPLVALGTIRLLQDNKFILYTITLFLSIFSNYYIGFFTCIFVLLVFICYQVCRCTDIKRFFMDLCRIALFSALAIGMTAALELPAFAALKNTQSSVNQFPQSFSLNIVDYSIYKPATQAWNAYKSAVEAGAELTTRIDLYITALKETIGPFMEGMRQIAGNMTGSHEFTFMEGLPNLYCGVPTILLAFLFLTSKEVKLRDKICSFLLLIFLMVSFLIPALDYIWHGFHFTNMIPYRFSFLFSFVLLYMAYRAWLLRDSFKLWQFIVAGVLSIGIFLCSDQRFTFVFLSYNLTLLLLTLGVFIYTLIDRKADQKIAETATPGTLIKREKARKKYSAWALFIIMGLELILTLANFGVRFSFSNVSNYPKQNANTTSAINYMYQRENGSDFFRAEVTHSQTLNDGALNNYNGISTFTSSANVRVTKFMEALGYAAKNTYNRYLFEEASPVSNLFLNLKYMIERDGDVEVNSYFDTIHNFGDVYLLKNNAYLPLGFLAESTLAEWDVTQNSNRFLVQNDLFSKATGIDQDVWTLLDGRRLTVTPSGVTIRSQSSTGLVSYQADTAGTLRYTYQIDRDGFLCFYVSLSERNNFRVYKNSKEQYIENVSLPEMMAVGDVQVGDTIIIEVICASGSSGTASIRPAIMDHEIFRQGYEILAASTLDLTEFSNTHLEGTIDCNRDGLLYTSVPYDGNWEVTVDGKPAEITLVGDCMIGMNLTAGTHTIRFVYKNNAFTIGVLISLACAAAFVGLIILSRSSPKSKGKYET